MHIVDDAEVPLSQDGRVLSYRPTRILDLLNLYKTVFTANMRCKVLVTTQ